MLGSMEFYLLASGSKGNCFVLKTAATQIVIDCGTTKTYLTRSFHMIGVDYLNTEALLVTHGHRDHTSQLKMFSGVEAYAAFVWKTARISTGSSPTRHFRWAISE